MMSSPRLTDTELEQQFGKRSQGQPFDYPQELGYICPEGDGGDWLTWSEFKEHIWCYKCEMDYHYAIDCRLKRMCWMTDEQWNDFLNSLPMKPTVLNGIQHFPDCEIPHNPKTNNLLHNVGMKLLCRLGVHKYGKFQLHPYQGNKITRQCKRCKQWQDKRLF